MGSYGPWRFGRRLLRPRTLAAHGVCWIAMIDLIHSIDGLVWSGHRRPDQHERLWPALTVLVGVVVFAVIAAL